jgi:hypothetical protein
MRKGVAVALTLLLVGRLLAGGDPVTMDWPENDLNGSLRLRFRLSGVDSTFDLPARAENRIAQTVLLDTPRFRVNLNVDRNKTTLHFFLFADPAENGAWAMTGVEKLEGVPETPFKVGVIDLSHLKGGRDYELWLNWDLEAKTLRIWLNGELQGDPFTANRQPWTPASPRKTPARVGTALQDGDDSFPLHILAAEAFSPPAPEARIQASAKDLARLENEGRVVFSAPLDLSAYQKNLVYAPDFSEARILSEADLFDAENQRVRAPTEDEWVLEGNARVTATADGMHLDTRPEGEDTPEITSAKGHLVLWAPTTLPENFLLEYDFTPESPRRGLHILFWNALARSGADIFAPDSGLPARNGVFSQYTWRGVNSYHASLFATDDEEPRRVANLRKNSGFVLAACGEDAVYGAEGPVRIRLLRDGPLMRLEANGREVMRYTDDGKANGPPLQGGRFGFRIMAHTGAARISNLKLYDLTPLSNETQGKLLLNFQGMNAEEIPADWQIEGDQGLSILHQDPLVEGRGYLQLMQSADAPTTLRLPLPALTEAGRLTLRLAVRSPQSKWLQARLSRNGSAVGAKNIALGRSWRVEPLDLALPAGGPMELSLSFHGEGRVDLESLEIRHTDAKTLRDRAALLERPGHAGNLLRNSRLPLGLPSGWHLDRGVDDKTDLDLSADPDVPGPSGFPSLRVHSRRPVAFFTEPFMPTRPGEIHTARLQIRGPATGRLQIFQDGVPVAEDLSFSVEDEWTEQRLSFPTAPLARLSTLRIEIDGTAWLDGFQMYAGTDPLPVANRAEVALSVPRFSRVVFHNEPLDIAWTVTGAPEGALLRSRVVNLYGDQARLAPITLDAIPTSSGTLHADLFPERPLGQFRIEARVESENGKALGPWNELVVTRLQRPLGLGELHPESPFGIHVPATARHLEMAGAIGMRWVRLHDIGGNQWFHLEPRPGEWNFRDEGILRTREAGFEILGVLVTSPLWANAWPGEEKALVHSYWDMFGMPGDLDAFANYVRVFTQRYEGVIDAHEIWNEPWVPRFFSGNRELQPVGEPEYSHSENPQRDYADLSHAARKGAGPDVVLAGLNSSAGATLANRISGTDWTRGVLKADGIAPVDVVTYHHYSPALSAYPGDDVEAGFQRAIGPLLEEGLRPRVWMSEGSNTPGGLPGTFYQHTLPSHDSVNLADSADGLVRYVLSLLASGNEKVFLYSMHAHGLWGRHDRFVSLVQPDGYLHPDAVAFSALSHALEGATFVSRTRGEDQATRYLFQSPDRRVLLTAPHPEHPIPAPSGSRDLWGNPARGPQHRLFKLRIRK